MPATPVVIAAHDFSQDSHTALRLAATLAREWKARLGVLHVFDDGAWASLRQLYRADLWASEGGPTLAARTQLSRQSLDLARDYGIETFPETRTGDAVTEIARFTREQGACLLVLGAHGLGQASLLGTTALHVLERMHAPVLLTRDGSAAYPTRLMIATEDSEGARRAAQRAHELFPQARLLVTHAYRTESPDRLRLDGTSEEEIGHILQTAQATAQGVVDAFIRECALPPMQTEPLLLNGFPGYALVEGVRQHRPELLVMGRHGRGHLDETLFGSVTRYAVEHAPTNVLLVP